MNLKALTYLSKEKKTESKRSLQKARTEVQEMFSIQEQHLQQKKGAQRTETREINEFEELAAHD
jgi:cellobiose-specific phosphotransferase system component IIA